MTQVPVRVRPSRGGGLGERGEASPGRRRKRSSPPASRTGTGRPRPGGPGRPSGARDRGGRRPLDERRGPSGRRRRTRSRPARCDRVAARRGTRPRARALKLGEHRERSADALARRVIVRDAPTGQRPPRPLCLSAAGPGSGPGHLDGAQSAGRIGVGTGCRRGAATALRRGGDGRDLDRDGGEGAARRGRSGRGCGRSWSSAPTRSRPTRRSGSNSRPTTSPIGPLPAYWLENKGVNSLWHVPIPPQAVGARLRYRSAARRDGTGPGLQPLAGRGRPAQPARPHRVAESPAAPEGLVGNRMMTARVDARGSTYDVYFPTVGPPLRRPPQRGGPARRAARTSGRSSAAWPSAVGSTGSPSGSPGRSSSAIRGRPTSW